MTAQAGGVSSRRPRGVTVAVYRHGAILFAALAAVILLGRAAPIDAQPIAWLAVAVGLGLVAALISGWLGLVFLLAGMALGATLDLAARHAGTAEAADYIAVTAPSYMVTAIVATAAFAVSLLARRRLL